MKENIDFVSIVKSLLEEEKYIKLLTDIARENNSKEISLERHFKEIANKYCLIILLIGLSNGSELCEYKIIVKGKLIKINSKKFEAKYKTYIESVKSRKQEIIEEFSKK